MNKRKNKKKKIADLDRQEETYRLLKLSEMLDDESLHALNVQLLSTLKTISDLPSKRFRIIFRAIE